MASQMSRVDKTVWGSIYWNFLHMIVGNLPDKLVHADIKRVQNVIFATIDSIQCIECKTHANQYIALHMTPGWSTSRVDWQEWMKNFHAATSRQHIGWTVARIDKELLKIESETTTAPTTLATPVVSATLVVSTPVANVVPKLTPQQVTAPIMRQQMGFIRDPSAALLPGRESNMNHPSMIRSSLPSFTSQKPAYIPRSMMQPLSIVLQPRLSVPETVQARAVPQPRKAGCGCRRG